MFFNRYDLNKDQQLFDAVNEISQDISLCYQPQNDFHDCFGDPNYDMNKPGHDIQYGKFSWFAAMTMELGNKEQKDVLRKYYGNPGKI